MEEGEKVEPGEERLLGIKCIVEGDERKENELVNKKREGKRIRYEEWEL